MVDDSGACRTGVLLVECDDATRRAIAAVLADEAYPVHAATTASEAIERLRELGPPCVILIDLQLPVGGGIELLTRLRRDPALASVPVYVISACEGDAARLKGLPFLRKPLELDALVGVVARHCSGARLQ